MLSVAIIHICYMAISIKPWTIIEGYSKGSSFNMLMFQLCLKELSPDWKEQILNTFQNYY